MKFSHRFFAGAMALAAAGCSESSTPTSPQLEQAVFTALGGLEVWEALTVTGPSAAQIFVGGTGTVGEFVYVPFHASNSYGVDLQISVRGEAITPVFSKSNFSAVRTGPLRVDPSAIEGSLLHERLHAKLQSAAQTQLPRIQRRLRAGLSLSPRGDLRGSSATVGELIELNTATSGAACQSVDLRTGRVEAITQRAIVVGDVNNPSGGFTRADYESFGREFDTLVHPTVTRFFDNPTDIDENGKVIIFVTRAVNELTGPNDDGFVGGFFYARDLFPRGVDGCAASNEGEIFFVLAPDPLAEASPLKHTRDDVFDSSVGTIGHEYQHLINAGRRIYVNNADDFEDSWLDEGLGHIAEELLFYAASGLTPESNIAQSSFTPDVIAALNRFGVQNLARYGSYLEKVPRESPTGPDNLETRGAAWSFLRYVADHTEESDEEFFKALVNSKASGIENLELALDGEDATDWFRQWGVSVFTDDLAPAEADPLLKQPSWNFRSLLPLIFNNVFPLEVETLGSGETVQFNVRSMASAYLRFAGQENTLSTLFTTSGGAAPPAGLQVTVVRIR